MGFQGISIAQLAILLLIVLAIFGTKKLRTLGDDLGKAVKSFRSALNEADAEAKTSSEPPKKVANTPSDPETPSC